MSAEDNQVVDDGDTVSMMEVLAEQSRMQEDVSAVLGPLDDKCCTYKQGYVKRQALYACSTCETTEAAGICLACSYHCHEGHELYELYTKRNFRCDCGNEKFQDTKCKLDPAKNVVNEENQYNQNFKGSYCTCARPYPDPEDEIEDEMIQCAICEDWYHGRHLGTVMPDDDSYNEMICAGCMDKHQFLWAYQVSSTDVNVLREAGDDQTVDIDGEGDTMKKEGVPGKEETSMTVEKNQGTVGTAELTDKIEDKGQKIVFSFCTQPADSTIVSDCSSTNASANEEPAAKRRRTEESPDSENSAGEQCLLLSLQKRQFAVRDCAAFWQDDWREKLCKCRTCLALYKKEGIGYLTDMEDTVKAYEETGKMKDQELSEQEQEQHLLSGMNHVQKIEMIHGFNDLKTQLSSFFSGFARSGKVVTKEDVQEFFAQMERRRKEQGPSVQYMCK